MRNCSFIKAFSAIFHSLFDQRSSTVQFGFRRFTFAFVILITSMVILSHTAEAKVYVVQTRSGMKPKCKVQQNSELHVLMDRICLLCHEMFSHERPNMRSECRSNCFRSEHFRKCLAVFNPGRQAAKILMEL